MAATQDTPLDEIQWRSPAIAQSMGGIHTNSVLHYFAQSPFFDATSNNATLTTQATYNPSMLHLVQTRDAFENRLRTMQGLEFTVAYGPAQPGPAEDQTGVWVIRKQNRRKRPGYADEVTVLNMYFVVGENIYMSPSVASVIGSRLLSTVTSLTNYLATASALPLFSPSLGNTYMRPIPKALTAASNSHSVQASKESTPLPEPAGASATKSSSAGNAMMQTSLSGESLHEVRSLAESFSLTLRYMDEYMDENPLLGEPGSFIFSSTHAPSHPKKDVAVVDATANDDNAATTAATATAAVTATVAGKRPSKSTEKTPTSPGGAGKSKRRKSKPAALPAGDVSPT
ncbi:MAG: hypothetical protein M1826_002689 [Phylliscum demangeonii]|nr:MAG: hypothetical protein M1826_002689 [Phylliscum demangeonii]